MERVELTGLELQRFLARLTGAGAAIAMLRVWVNGLKYTINNDGWSPLIGDLRTDEY